MKITGLPFDNETGYLYSEEDTIDYTTLDGCFRIINGSKVITDSNGFLPTFVNCASKSVIDNKSFKFYEVPYIDVPDNSIFDFNTFQNTYYAYPKSIENIFEYFENWFPLIYSKIEEKYKKVFLSITMGLDSRYLLAILYSRGIHPSMSSWGDEGKSIQRYIPEVIYIDITKNRHRKMKEYIDYYKECNFKDWNNEYLVYLYYSILVENNVDVLVEGLGRNFYCTKPRIWTSQDIYKVRTSFSCGRAPLILENKIKTFYPYSCRDIRFNLRKLNISELDMVKMISERIKYLDKSLYEIPTKSIEKACNGDKIVSEELKNFFLMKNIYHYIRIR